MTDGEAYKNFLKLGLNGFKALPATEQWKLLEELPTPADVLKCMEAQQIVTDDTIAGFQKYSLLYQRVLQYVETQPKASVLRGLARRYRDGRLTTKCNLEGIAEEFC